MTAELCVFAADPNTPANASDTWRQGGFHLHQRSTQGANVKVGTQKWYECTGREPGQKKIPGQKCGFRVKVEFVSHVDGTEHSGWVVKQVIGGSHQVGDSEHKLAITTAEVTSDARLSAGTSQLSLEPYISLGRTLASAGMRTCTCRAPVGTGMPCLHQTAAAMLPLPPKYGVHRYAADIEMFHDVFRLSTECEDGVPTDSGPQATSTEQDVPLTTRHKHTRHEAELATWTALTRYTEPLGLTLTVCTFWPGVFASLSTPYTSTGQIQSHQDHGRDGSSCGSVRPRRVRRPPESYIGISQGPHEATAGVG